MAAACLLLSPASGKWEALQLLLGGTQALTDAVCADGGVIIEHPFQCFQIVDLPYSQTDGSLSGFQEDMIDSVSLLALTDIAPWLRAAYFGVLGAMATMGIVTLTLQNYSGIFWQKYKNAISLLLNMMGVLLLVLSTQPYGAILLLIFFVIKLIVKNRI